MTDAKGEPRVGAYGRLRGSEGEQKNLRGGTDLRQRGRPLIFWRRPGRAAHDQLGREVIMMRRSALRPVENPIQQDPRGLATHLVRVLMNRRQRWREICREG